MRPGQPFSEHPETERSLRHSIKDGVFYSMMTGGAESYFSAYGILLALSTPLIGVLASLPPLLASFMQIVSAWLGRKLGKRKAIIVGGAALQALTLLPIGFVAFAHPDWRPAALIALVFVYFCGPNLGAPQWSSLIGDLLKERYRGRFLAARTRYATVASLAALVVAGFVIDAFDRADAAAYGFFVVFVGAAAARLVSTYHLTRMRDPGRDVAALSLPKDRSWLSRARSTGLLRFSVFFASMQAAVAVSGPYFTLYMLRDLHLSYLEFMVITFASVLVQFLTLNRWGRLADLFGNRLILVTTATLITIIPAMWLVSTHFLWLIAVQMLSGLCWAGFTLSATAFVFDLTPAAERQALFAAHNVLGAIGVFAGATLGGLAVAYVPESLSVGSYSVAVATPLLGLFTLSCFARIAVILLFLRTIREVRRVRPMSAPGLMFRVTRMHPVSGLIYEVVSRISDASGRGDRKRDDERADGD